MNDQATINRNEGMNTQVVLEQGETVYTTLKLNMLMRDYRLGEIAHTISGAPQIFVLAAFSKLIAGGVDRKGTIQITDRRLLFATDRMENYIHGQPINKSIQLDDIRGISINTKLIRPIITIASETPQYPT
jgi:hypothetical protein